MRRALPLLAATMLLWLVAPAVAQTGPTPARVTRVFLQVRDAQGTVINTQETQFPLDWTCDQPAPAIEAAPFANPTQVAMRDPDPARPTRFCKTTQTAFFRLLPAATGYQMWVATASTDVPGSTLQADYVMATMPSNFSAASIFLPPPPAKDVRVVR